MCSLNYYLYIWTYMHLYISSLFSSQFNLPAKRFNAMSYVILSILESKRSHFIISFTKCHCLSELCKKRWGSFENALNDGGVSFSEPTAERRRFIVCRDVAWQALSSTEFNTDDKLPWQHMIWILSDIALTTYTAPALNADPRIRGLSMEANVRDMVLCGEKKFHQ